YKNKVTKNKYRNNGYIIILLLSTGMRVNECLARKWKDYDVINRSLVINSSMSRKKNTSSQNGELKNIKIETTPKTQSGIRIIPLSEMSMWAIKQLELQNPNHKSSDYICLNSSGLQNEIASPSAPARAVRPMR
ncbi:MAG: tyrosine-type recombinase/integrase, partial [Akkermansia sp.]